MDKTVLGTISAIEEYLWVINKSIQELKKGLVEYPPAPPPPIHPADADQVLDIQQCSKLTGIAVSTLYKYCSNRTVPFYKSGKRNLFKRSQILEWLTSNEVKTLSQLEAETDQYMYKQH